MKTKYNLDLNRLSKTFAHKLSNKVHIHDAFSIGQLNSKYWLIDKLEGLDLDLSNIWILGGWVGTLSYLMFGSNYLKFNNIHSFDIDNNCTILAEILNKSKLIDNWKFKATTLDVNNLQYTNFTFNTNTDNGIQQITGNCDTIINTSCDHMGDNFTWWNNIPNGKLVILQNNDFTEIDDHDNIVTSIEEFSKLYPMKEYLYTGILDCKLYNRYMLIGRK